jgi:hypothetical protein
MDEQTLRRQARARIQQGLLPAEEPLRTWVGPGGEYACALCEHPVVRSETEFELGVEIIQAPPNTGIVMSGGEGSEPGRRQRDT